MAEIFQYPPEWLVFLDETGSDHKDHIRKFGYSLIGEPPVYHRFLGRGTRISAIAALSTEGLACYELITGTTNGDKLYDFITLQKQSCYFSKVFGYHSCVTILTMQIL